MSRQRKRTRRDRRQHNKAESLHALHDPLVHGHHGLCGRLARARHELAADRRLRRRARGLPNLGANRLLRAPVAARRDAGEHPLQDHPAERVTGGEVAVV